MRDVHYAMYKKNDKKKKQSQKKKKKKGGEGLVSVGERRREREWKKTKFRFSLISMEI